jgi:hypothetical protein
VGQVMLVIAVSGSRLEVLKRGVSEPSDLAPLQPVSIPMRKSIRMNSPELSKCGVRNRGTHRNTHMILEKSSTQTSINYHE